MRKPILTYKDKVFYNFDEVTDYILELDSNDEYLIFWRNIRAQIRASEELQDMEFSRNEFIRECALLSTPFNYTIASIICFENIFRNPIKQWRKYLIDSVKQLIDFETHEIVNKEILIKDVLLIGYANSYKDCMTYLDSDIYDLLLKDEMSKVNKSFTKNQYIISYIETNILPNIETLVEQNKERVYNLFVALFKACNKSDILIFQKAVDKFISN